MRFISDKKYDHSHGLVFSFDVEYLRVGKIMYYENLSAVKKCFQSKYYEVKDFFKKNHTINQQ